MKKRTFLFLTAVLCLTVFSCAKTEAPEDTSIAGSSSEAAVEPSDSEEIPEDVPEGYIRVSLMAGTESSKTTISDGSGDARIVSWAVGDEIKIHYSGGSTSTAVATAGTSAKMMFDVPEAISTVYMAYPKAATSSLASTTLSVTIPAEQDGNFATANYSVARAGVSDSKVQFYNASSLIKIVLTDGTLTKAVITGANGEALAGTVPFTFGESGVTPGVASSTSTQLTVNFSGAKTYYVATLPGVSLTNGFSVKFYRGDTPAGGWKTSSATTIARAKIASMGELDKSACFRYVTVSGAGTKSGRSWANAWGRDELKAFLVNTSSAYTADDLDLMDGVTFLMGAGTYVLPDNSGEKPTMNYSAVTTKQLTFHFVGGYPAAGGSTATPATNVTALSGGEKGAVLWITRNYHVSFDGFTITKSRTSGGGEGAMRHTAAGSLALSNCIFTDNVNTATCGALGISGGCTFTINSCTFDSNSGGNGGAFNPSSNGTVTNCTFSNNQTTATTGYGGAIKLEYGTVAFSECTFTGNHTALTGDGVNTCGGCMWITSGANASFEDCVFKGNQSSNVGGVLHSNGTAPTITFEDCTFGGPNSGDGNTANGGGVASLSAGYLTFTNCTFQGNSVGDWGGAIMTWASPSVGSLTINGTNGSYKSNSAEGGGFLCVQDGASATIDGGVFDGNQADNGGVVYIKGSSTLSICNTEMKNNSATTNYGGVIFVEDSPTVNLGASGSSKGNNIHDNSAPAAGGVIAVVGASTESTNTPNINIYSGNTFKANHANEGGAIKFLASGSSTKANLTITGSNTFDSNYAANGPGGAMILRTSGTVSISGATFKNNYINSNANLRGGAVNINEGGFSTGNFTFSECVFDGNSANQSPGNYNGPKGGAINNGGTFAKINKCLFKNNSATQGGAISFDSSSATTYMNDCVFTGNYISFRYGTTFYLNGGKIFLNNCSFADDTYSTEGWNKQCTWFQGKADKFILSNSTMIGSTRHNTSVSSDSSPLIRVEGNSSTWYYINSIVASSSTSISILMESSGSSTTNLISNKMTSKTMQGTVNASGTNSDGFSGTSSGFGSLAWTAGSTPAWNNCYWSWNGTLSGGSNTNKASLSDVKSAINTADSDFYTWLNGLGALDQDGRGKTRGSTTWPGAYDATNN